MTKPLAEYTVADWKRLRPITHLLKTARYAVIDRRYRTRPAAVGDPKALAKTLPGRKVLFTVAYEDAEVIAWQIPLVRHYVPNVLHVVVDNSSRDSEARTIERVTTEARASYLRAPPNPWRNHSTSSSRSHGIVLNWIWHNIVLPGSPAAFGFLDDDLFPTAPHDPFGPLATQDVYGVVRNAGERWFLWAGFTFMRFSSVSRLRLDFGQDWFIGLDTGGANWRPLYSRLKLNALQIAPSQFVPYRNDVAVDEGRLQWCDETWLHEVGQTGLPELMADKRPAVAAILAPHLAAARTASSAALPSCA